MSANLKFKSTPVRERVSKEEWEMRVDLAAAYQLGAIYKWTDLIYTHFSARVPGTEDFLLNPYGLMFDEITASSLIKIDIQGKVLQETPFPINPAGFVIHSAVHGAREDVVCVIHTHSRAGTAISALKEGLVPVNQGGFQFHDRIAYHDYEGFALDAAERQRLVEDLGAKRAMILRNPGLLTAGRSVAEAFRLMYYLEQACQVRLDALQSGREINLPPESVREHTARQWEGGAAGIGTTTLREWPALLRMLDRRDPSYRD
jgi:ribulose-5-phosphate 4-epimerase/fuculose-1-phosphate aldolase